MSAKVVRLGDEYDDQCRRALRDVLRAMGASLDEETWALAGSQEVVRARATIGGRALTIEAETYVGLTVRGDAALVDEVASRVAASMTRLTPDG